jgi:predicted signal transduction protein with EAL and GGDEF domain
MRSDDDPARAEFNPSARSGHIARLGGDEFIVILPTIAAAADAAAVAARLIAELREPMRLAAHTLVITPSIGIAIYPFDGLDAETLLRNADLAMYIAKRRGPGSQVFFDEGMNAAAVRRFKLEDKLRGALGRGAFSVNYQPQFDVRSASLSGMEALLCWTDDELGSVPAQEFMPIAEETGLILSVGEWVLRTACLLAKAWHDEGLPVVRMAVNVWGQQFAHREFPASLASIIRETGLAAELLELEIPESVIMRDEAWTGTMLSALKELGVSIAIDDFGAGYSSFGRLRKFAVDRLKIDRSFMSGLTEDGEDRGIAAAIIAMSHSLNIDVAAQGVESFPQLLFLQEHDCHEAQGYLFSHALPAVDAHRVLQRAAETPDNSRTQRLRSLIQ